MSVVPVWMMDDSKPDGARHAGGGITTFQLHISVCTTSVRLSATSGEVPVTPYQSENTMQRRHLLKALSLVAVSAALFTSAGAHADGKVVKVGTIGGPDAQIWQVVQKVAKRDGLDVKIVEFNDYVQPNAALDAGDLDANSFQHQPYLDSQIKQRGYKLVNAGLTYISPLGVYSKKLKSLKDLPEGAKIAVPNDPSNENRALLLLQSQGVIKLKAGAGTNGSNATPLDVAGNPKKIKLVELDAAQLPRTLADVDAAAINTNFALAAGLQPGKDAIALEDVHSPYANLIAVRAKDKDQPWVKKLVAAYQSEDVRQFLKTEFKGSMVPSF
jgi:D-methionine transport system substrate-binding protein